MNIYRPSDRFLLHLVHEAIDKFHVLFPNEEPFIKITCLRDKKLMAKLKSDSLHWRKIKVTKGSDVVEVIESKSTTIETKSVKNLIEKNRLTKYKIKDGQEIKMKPANITSKDMKKYSKDLKSKIVLSSELDIQYDEFEQPPYAAQIEIQQNRLEDTSHFIRHNHIMGTIEQQSADTFELTKDKVLVLPDKVQMNEQGMNYLVNTLQLRQKEDEELATEVKRLQLLDLDRHIKETEYQGTIASLQTQVKELQKSVLIDQKCVCSEIRGLLLSNFKVDQDPLESIKKYISIQEKLNILKKKIHKYTTAYELDWENVVKKHGFILSIYFLVDFWHDLSEDTVGEFDHG